MTVTTISNSVGHGIILGSGNYGLTLTVAGGGGIQGIGYAVYGLSSHEVLVNDGLIAAAGYGIVLGAQASLLNAGSISGGIIGAVMSGYDVSLANGIGIEPFTNTGRISGGTYGVYLASVTASNAGTITGNKTGVRMKGGSLVNSNSISGGTIGIVLKYGVLTNTESGHISSQGIGVYGALLSDGAVQISNAGAILGGVAGVYAKNGTFTNAGTIGGGTVGVGLSVAENGGAFGANSGLIYGETVGVYLYGTAAGPAGDFANYAAGIIESAYGVGLSDIDQLYVLNNGIVAGKAAGAYVSGSSLTNTNIIDGGSIGLTAYNAKVTDSGAIIGGSFAIEATGSFTLNLTNTAGLTGKVLDETGTGVLMLEGTGPGSLGGLGTTINGFSVVDFSADWTLEGNAAALAAGQVINGFTASDTLVLDGVSVSSASITAAGLVLRNGATTETIDLATVPAIADLSITSNGSNSTITFVQPLEPISIISTFEPATITLGTNNIAKSLTIASSGYAAGIRSDSLNWGTVTNYGGVNNVYLNFLSTLFNYGIIEGRIGVYAPYSNQLTNAGTIIGTNGIAVGLYSDGTLNNSGDIFSAGTAVEIADYGSIVNTGSIAGDVFMDGYLKNSGDISGKSLFGIGGRSADIENSGTITGPEDGIAEYVGDTIINTGTISGAAFGISLTGATIIDSGLISGATAAIFNGAFNNSGQTYKISLEVNPGACFAGGVVDQSNEGTLLLGGSTAGALDMGTSFSGLSEISFDSGSVWRLEGAAADLAGRQTIAGFSFADTIILDNFVVNTLDTTYVTGSGLQLADTAGNHLTLDITGNFTTADFIVTDPVGATSIELAVCYLRGTRIATPAGDVPVEALNIGDAVITRFNGYRKIKWIGRQSFARQFIKNNFDQVPVRVTAGALGANLPRRDLLISPGHSMLIDGVLVLAKSLVNGVTITQDWTPEEIHYYQIEFETHDCVLAEGAWAESYADTPDFRAKFHNAAEFYALYPGHREPEEQMLCAPRPLKGPALAAALLPIVQRATAAPGRLHGYMDGIAGATVHGWAWDEANPHLPVALDILLQSRIIGHVLACDYRADLEEAGYGHGRCGFEFSSGLGLPIDAARHLRIRRATDGAQIPLSDSLSTLAGLPSPPHLGRCMSNRLSGRMRA
jgi:hypothetical protein